MSEETKRLPSPEPGSFPEGFDRESIYYWEDRGTWFVHLPPDWLATLAAHDVTEHEDGTITVSPSILVRQPGGPKAGRRHGFLRRGVWEPCGDDQPYPNPRRTP